MQKNIAAIAILGAAYYLYNKFWKKEDVAAEAPDSPSTQLEEQVPPSPPQEGRPRAEIHAFNCPISL